MMEDAISVPSSDHSSARRGFGTLPNASFAIHPMERVFGSGGKCLSTGLSHSPHGANCNRSHPRGISLVLRSRPDADLSRYPLNSR